MHGNQSIGLFIFAISTASVLSAVIHYYFWRRFVKDTHLSMPWRRVATWAIILLCVGMNSSMFLGRVLSFETGRIVLFIPRIWMGFIMVLLAVLFASDLVKLIWRGARAVRREGPIEPERRIFFSKVVAGVSAFSTAGFSAFAVPKAICNAHIKNVEVALAKLPKALDGFKIAQITDLHIGMSLGGEWLREIVRKTNALNPDAIVITGDMIDGPPERIIEEVAPIQDLKAPQGVFFVTGNHEYYSDILKWMPLFEKMGLKMLHNELVRVGRGDHTFDLAGVDDYRAHNLEPEHGPDLEKAVKGRDPNRELVLLAHQPKAVFEAALHGVGLQLSGHTHGGQLWPFNHLVHLAQPYTRGLNRHTDRTQIYVSEGTGFWGPPMRSGTKSEITLLKLYSA
ncbi:MAG: metallophosphoesterase [Proteobacteria bacterium]|nr:metallophosphoesterase [Pseudomonadota bacterium]